LCGLLAGCGLDDYEKRMAEAQARVQRFDLENQVLDGPLEIPTRIVRTKQGDQEIKTEVPIIEVFLRPPKGISRTIAVVKNPNTGKDEKERPRGGFLYRYPRKEEKKENAPPPPPPDPTQPPPPEPPVLTDLYLGFEPNLSPKDPKAFDGFVKDTVLIFSPKSLGTTSRIIQPPNRNPMTFSVVDVKDEEKKVTYSVWVYQAGMKAVVVVFRIKGPPEGLKTSLDLCLESMAVGEEAMPLKIAYGKRPPPRAPAPSSPAPQ
jgi:hypothetical protein